MYIHTLLVRWGRPSAAAATASALSPARTRAPPLPRRAPSGCLFWRWRSSLARRFSALQSFLSSSPLNCGRWRFTNCMTFCAFGRGVIVRAVQAHNLQEAGNSFPVHANCMAAHHGSSAKGYAGRTAPLHKR